MTGTPVAGSARVSTEIPQPTPQYEHAVRVVWVVTWSAPSACPDGLWRGSDVLGGTVWGVVLGRVATTVIRRLRAR